MHETISASTAKEGGHTLRWQPKTAGVGLPDAPFDEDEDFPPCQETTKAQLPTPRDFGQGAASGAAALTSSSAIRWTQPSTSSSSSSSAGDTLICKHHREKQVCLSDNRRVSRRASADRRSRRPEAALAELARLASTLRGQLALVDRDCWHPGPLSGCREDTGAEGSHGKKLPPGGTAAAAEQHRGQAD